MSWCVWAQTSSLSCRDRERPKLNTECLQWQATEELCPWPSKLSCITQPITLLLIIIHSKSQRSAFKNRPKQNYIKRGNVTKSQDVTQARRSRKSYCIFLICEIRRCMCVIFQYHIRIYTRGLVCITCQNCCSRIILKSYICHSINVMIHMRTWTGLYANIFCLCKQRQSWTLQEHSINKNILVMLNRPAVYEY